MNGKQIYASGNLSALYMLQSVALSFLVAGIFLALKLQEAPADVLIPPATYIAWSIVLAATAALAPVAVCIYASRVISQIVLIGSGATVQVRSSLIGATAKVWRADDLRILNVSPGDARGEQSFALPRVELLARTNKRSRRYVLALKTPKHLRALKAVIKS